MLKRAASHNLRFKNTFNKTFIISQTVHEDNSNKSIHIYKTSLKVVNNS